MLIDYSSGPGRLFVRGDNPGNLKAGLHKLLDGFYSLNKDFKVLCPFYPVQLEGFNNLEFGVFRADTDFFRFIAPRKL
jgi:hypothetical protein